ncbi:MAG: right-handed parallel beta-helix repeat-containing protein [Candidatus Thorarchaeota archaeon]|nr:MAG: right-handed parallel beta-helix repeat-containing protein [Candidatus Thorarchaeota archaeon]
MKHSDYLAALLFLLLSLAVHPMLLADTHLVGHSDAVTHTTKQYDEPISLDSESDLSSFDLNGSGTQNDPFVISNLFFYPDETSITIKNTRSHLVIENIESWNLDEYSGENPDGISLENVTNVVIRECTFKVLGSGIQIENSSDCEVYNNTIHNSARGVVLGRSRNIGVRQNTVYSNSHGISVGDTNDSLVFQNTVVYSASEGIVMYGENNLVYANRFGWNGAGNARELSGDNRWDDGSGLGNFWSDYAGSDTYEIQGPGEGEDRYPSLLSGDFAGPVLSGGTWLGGLGEGGPPLDRLHFEVSVTDTSGVESVCFWYKVGGGVWNYTQMAHEPTADNPARYVYEIPGPIYGIEMEYFYSATDSLGYYSETRHTSFAIFTDPFYWLGWAIAIVTIIAVTVMAVCYYTRR